MPGRSSWRSSQRARRRWRATDAAAAHELALGRISAGRTAHLLDLEDDLLDVQLTMLRVPDHG